MKMVSRTFFQRIAECAAAGGNQRWRRRAIESLAGRATM